MFDVARRWTWRGLRLLSVAAASLAGCGGSDSDPRVQPPDPQGAYFTGEAILFDETASPGTLYPTVAARAKGTKGLERTTAAASGPAYSVSGSGLTGPYLVSAGYMAATTTVGHTNATALTDLQASVLLGQDAVTVFASYGLGSTEATLITEDNLKAAQARVTAFLKSEFDITVESGDADFVTSSFDPAPGDPMYDTLLAIDTKRREIGVDAFYAKTTALIQEAGNCLREKIGVTVSGKTQDFCPSVKTAERESADDTVIDYVFTTLSGAAFTVRVQDDVVLDASFRNAGSSKLSTCSGSACKISLSTLDPDDETRTLGFDESKLSGSGGTVVVSGILTGAQPGVVLPTLPCTSNYRYLVLPDRSVLATCDASNASVLGLPGSFGSQQGGADADVQLYLFADYDANVGTGPTDDTVTVYATVQTGEILSINVTRRNVATGELTLDYKCRAPDCNGVTIGPSTADSSSGFNALLSTLRFANTKLSLVNADGSLSPDVKATLTGAYNTVFVSAADFGATPAVQASDCAGTSEVVTAAPSNEPNIYAICPERSGLPTPSANALTLTDGSGVRISFPATLPVTNPSQSPIAVDYLSLLVDGDGRVTQVTYSQNNIYGGNGLGETFACTDNCPGVSVSAPDADGVRSVTFSDATLHVVEADGFATDPRTAAVNGSFVVPLAVPESAAAEPAAMRLRGR